MKPDNGRKVNPEKGLKVFPLEKFQELLNVANPLCSLIYLWAGLTGLRECEILWIRVEDINFIDNTLKYRVAKRNIITERQIPNIVLEKTKQWIKKHNLTETDFLFKIQKGRYTGNRYHEKSLMKQTRKYFDLLGLSQKKIMTRKKSKNSPIKSTALYYYTFHSLRHMFGTLFYKLTLDRNFTAWSLRHSNNQTVDTYINIMNYEKELEITTKIQKIILKS